MPEKLHYLFVCYANADRSPTVEAVCRKIAADNGLEIEASSAGVSRGANRPVTKEMADLADMQKVPLFGNRWVRDDDSFAVRIDEWDVKGTLTKGLDVEHGTTGMVFQQGRYCGCVDGGRYDMNGFLKKVNNFNQTTPTAIVLVDAGDVELHLEAIKLYSQEHLEVDAIFKAMVRLRDPEKRFTNAFKGRNHLTVGYLANSLMDELRAALQTYVGGRPVDDLYNNADLRKDVERQMQLELEPILERIGLEMVQLRFVDFFCPTYDPIRQKEAELYVDTRDADVQIDRLKRKREFAFNREKTVLLQEIEITGIRDEHERNRVRAALIARIENDNFEHQAGLERQLAEVKTEAESRKIRLEMDRLESEQDFGEAEKAIELRRKSQMVQIEMDEHKQRLEAKTLEDRSKASAQALLSILDGPAADRILKLEEFRAKEKLTPAARTPWST